MDAVDLGALRWIDNLLLWVAVAAVFLPLKKKVNLSHFWHVLYRAAPFSSVSMV